MHFKLRKNTVRRPTLAAGLVAVSEETSCVCRIPVMDQRAKESKAYRREREKSLADLNVSSRTSVAIEQCEERLN